MLSADEDVQTFSKIIMDYAKSESLGYIDAITQYCENVGLEIEVAAKLLAPSITSSIEDEARQNNLLKKSARLPI